MRRKAKLFFVVLVLVLVSMIIIPFALILAHRFLPSVIISDNLDIMKNLNNSSTWIAIRKMNYTFDRNYNFSELYQWEHQKVDFVNDGTFSRSVDPIEILEIGKGECGEFSILYVALCLAHGYQSRLVLAVDVSHRVYWLTLHGWSEVKLGNQWVPVDPSDQVWNQTSHYKNWPWGKEIGSSVRIYAFEDGKVIDVTKKYQG